MKLNRLLLLFCTAILMYSCSNNNQEPKGELITVKLSPSFISLNQDTDVPMNVKGKNVKMTVDPNQVIYAIQVYENDSAYYYGLFDNVDSMKIAITTGKNYRFKIATYKVGTGTGLKQDILADGKYFYLPNKTMLGNKFVKGNALKDINLISSIKLTKTQVKDYPEIDAFYCDKSVAVTKGLTNIDFSLLRMGFGVTFNVDTLTNGKVLVFIGNDTITMTNQNKTATSIRLFNVLTGDLSTIFTNANTYADSILIKVQWVGSNGTILNTQGMFNFTRNYQKTINIQLNTSSFNFNFEGWNTNAVTTLITDTLNLSPIIVGGVVTSDGSCNFTERGILYGLTSNLTISNSTLVGSFRYGLSSGGFDTPSTSNGKITSGSGNGTFSSIITHLLSNETYYIRAYAINSNGELYGDLLKFNTKNYIRDPRRFDIANVYWQWGSQNTLFDVQTDEIISPNTARNYDIWYSSNQNPTVNQTTLTSSSYNTCYKFKIQANCQRWCDIHNGILKP